MDGGVEFVKGHGTENDFLVLPDPDGRLDLTRARVRALCDRSRGLGADGVVRAVRAGRLPDGAGADPDAWFLDLRNADGGPAEMSGNGARVYARWLADAGLVRGDLVLATRAGPRPVRFPGGGAITVGMGPARAGAAAAVTVGGRSFDGVAVDVGNPHLVALTDVPVDGIDLTVPPGHDPAAFPHGVNVEFVNVLGPDRLRMRVHERGVGETRSCGTGTVAAAAAALHAGGRADGVVDVAVPGGRLSVEVRDGAATLTGPAVLVARGRLDADWWDAL